jgi:hypothetical protein
MYAFFPKFRINAFFPFSSTEWRHGKAQTPHRVCTANKKEGNDDNADNGNTEDTENAHMLSHPILGA